MSGPQLMLVQLWSAELEHQMRVSPAEVRRLRLERGWSQDHLAEVSGLSLRTVQRVEAEGVASISTATSLAASFNVQLLALQPTSEALPDVKAEKPTFAKFGLLVAGLAAITISLLNASFMGMQEIAGPLANVSAALSFAVGALGVFLLIRPTLVALRDREYAGLFFVLLGVPLLTYSLVGVVFGVLVRNIPSVPLLVIGLGGIAFIAMSVRRRLLLK